MSTTSKLKSVDFYRKIPRDLTEATLSGAGLSIIAALAMVFLFGMELSNYLAVDTTTAIIVDKSSDGEFLRIEFNISFPALSCEFASVDVSDVLGTNRLNITKTIRKFSIDPNLQPTGVEFHSGSVNKEIKHDDESNEEHEEGSISLHARNFDRVSHQHDILLVNFFAPWCYWSNRLKPSWEKAAKIIREKYDPEMDGRISLGKVDCTVEGDLCRRNHIQGYPSIRIFRKGTDINFLLNRDEHGHHNHESYYGDRDTDSLVKLAEGLVAPIPLANHALAAENKTSNSTEPVKRPAPSTGGCRIEGFVRVKKVPGYLIISARSASHSFDASKMNMSHVVNRLAFGKKVSPREMSDVKKILPYLGQNYERLSGRAFITQPDSSDANVTIEHYIQTVKTEIVSHGHSLVEEYEYTAHSSLMQSPDIPVAKFHIQSSPMQVLVTEKGKSFSHFITNVCAIIGGIFTVAGILDAVLHNTLRLMKKIDTDKQSTNPQEASLPPTLQINKK
ncbi:hypothetical protein V2J09_024253 [Rumex salicifolius]